MKKFQLVMRNREDAVICRSDVMPFADNPADNQLIVDIIRQWSRIGFNLGDNILIKEVE